MVTNMGYYYWVYNLSKNKVECVSFCTYYFKHMLFEDESECPEYDEISKEPFQGHKTPSYLLRILYGQDS